MKRRNKRIAVRLQRPPLDRMLRIHQELQAQKFPNASSMGNEMEISTKTVHRDVEFMRDRLRMPIEWDSARNGYTTLRPSPIFQRCTSPKGNLSLSSLRKRLCN